MSNDTTDNLSRALQLNRDINNTRHKIKKLTARNIEISAEKRSNAQIIEQEKKALDRYLDEQYETMKNING